ncbi:MAG: type 4a pilus biogenesis protein PilO [Candidatus Nealsonbacteria bacterium]
MIISFFIFIVVMGAVFLWPKYQKLQETQRNIKGAGVQIQEDRDYFANLEEINSKLREHQTELDKVLSSLPDDPSLPSVFSYLQETVPTSGLILEEIGSFSTVNVGSNINIRESKFSIDVTGYYQNFKNLLSVLEKSSRIIEIERVSFSSPGEEELSSFNMNLKTFSY